MNPSPVPIDADLLCGACRQNLRGVPDGRCPECGRPFRRDQLLSGRVPWEQRREIGRLRAYLATLRLVLRRPAALVRFADAPVDYAAARSFRRWTVIWATLVSGGVAAWLVRMIVTPRGLTSTADTPPFWGGDWSRSPLGVLSMLAAVARNLPFFVTSLIATALWLATVTRSAAWFFNDPRLTPAQRARAAALGQYGASPFAWVLCLVLLASMTFVPQAQVIGGGYADLQPRWELIALALLLLGIPVFWLFSSARLLRRVTACRRAAQWRYVMALPLLALLLALVIGLGTHLLLFHATLMWAGR